LVLATGVILGGVVAAAIPESSPEPKKETAPPQEAATPKDAPAPKAAPRNPNAASSLTVVKPFQQVAPKSEHKILAALAGKWSANVHLYTGPFPREKDVVGTAEGTLLMNGLFVQVAHAEKRMKQPYETTIIFGFDEVVGKYTSDTLETTSTAVIHHVGTYDAEKKQLVLSSHYSDQKTRQLTISRTVTTFVDASTWTYEEFISHRAGEAETPMVLITFRRS
jgi:hypothetical protein